MPPNVYVYCHIVMLAKFWRERTGRACMHYIVHTIMFRLFVSIFV